MKKIIKRIFKGFLLLLAAFILILVINNIITKAVYSGYDTDNDVLSADEVKQVKEVYEYLEKQGDKILPGFNGKIIDLIIFNEAYEFLICTESSDSEWKLLGYENSLGKNVYRRPSDNPQAFTVYRNGKWVGSMSTRANFTKSVTTSLSDAGIIGYLIPPQVFSTDKEHYKGLIIHEMTHAFQALMAEDRLVKDQTISNVSSNYDNARYQELIKEEAGYIEKAMKADNQDEIVQYTKLFLSTRKQRREECNMTANDVKTEIEFEWLEGLGRYAEYLSSTASTSTIRKNLDHIKTKVMEGGDERFYVLGMAQCLILDKINLSWKQDVFNDGFTLEAALEKAMNN